MQTASASAQQSPYCAQAASHQHAPFFDLPPQYFAPVFEAHDPGGTPLFADTHIEKAVGVDLFKLGEAGAGGHGGGNAYHALIRRAGGHAGTELVCGPLTLDTRSSRASVSGQALSLTSHEYRVLAYLMHHRGEIVSRSELIQHIYAQDFDRDSNTIEVFVGRLRKKLPPDLIETVRGLGYRLACPP